MEITYKFLKNRNVSHYLHFKQVATQARKIITELSGKNKQAFVTIKGSQNTIFLEEVTKALLAHPSEKNALVRQDTRREKKK